ncbi:MAG: hypothetical protein JWM06_1168 [Actinomycetia bacterium]|nr:hypothetical protein [Actinomycetes bacterium]
MTAAGLILGIVSSVAINGGYALQHASASALPPLTLRRPFHSLALLFRSGRWAAGFFAGIGGWVLYVAALALAPLSLVQAASAGGIAVLAIGGPRLTRPERIGVGAALGGLLLLGLSLGSHASSTHGKAAAVIVWMLASAGVAGATARLLPPGAGLGTAAGVLYAAGDVGTKAALAGGGRLLFVPALLACHAGAFACVQLAFQRGGRLATAGLAVLWTNALPIVAGTVLFGESLPGGWRGAARVAAFVLVLVGAVALSRRETPAAEGAAAPA